MAVSDKYDPYRHPTPYDVLEIREGLRADAKEIGKAYNRQRQEARRIKDISERAQRMKDLDRARDELLRPDDRVLLDFFGLSDKLFPELCLQFGRRLASEKPLRTAEFLGGLSADRPYDDLVPADLGALEKPCGVPDQPTFYPEPRDEQRLPLMDLDR